MKITLSKAKMRRGLKRAVELFVGGVYESNLISEGVNGEATGIDGNFQECQLGGDDWRLDASHGGEG